MLIEMKNPAQERIGFRRIFIDDYFDLYVWYEERNGPLIGFQLCYDKKGAEHCITWKKGKGYLHNKIDDGEKPGNMKSSPILLKDGMFDNDDVLIRFDMASTDIDPDIRDIVMLQLKEYTENETDPFLFGSPSML